MKDLLVGHNLTRYLPALSDSRSKGEKAILPLPPQGGLTGWRDPFLVGACFCSS